MVKDDRLASARAPREPILASLAIVTRATASTLLLLAGPIAFYIGMLVAGGLFAAIGEFRWWIWPLTAAAVVTWVALAGELLRGMGVSRARVRWMSIVASMWAAGPWLAVLIWFQIYGWPD
jgi:hypothetical protein